MAIFGKKKGEGDEVDAASATEAAPEAFSPANARKFFDAAQTRHETSNFEYAMQLWLNGLAWEPTNMEGLRAFLKSADAFVAENPKGRVSKDFSKGLSGKGAVRKYVEALLAFGLRPMDVGAALAAARGASELGVQEAAQFLGRHALNLAMREDKKKKDVFVKLLDVLDKAGDYQGAAQTGELACQLDPADTELQARVRNMMARATMNRGGFDEMGAEGGFRRIVKDLDKQLALEQADSIAKTASTKDAIVERTKGAYEARPDDVPSLEAYCRALVDRGRAPDMLRAMSLYNQAYKATGEFRFRQRSGEIQLRQSRRAVASLKQQVEARPEDAELRERYEQASKTLHDKELEELRLQVENYPTDLPLRFRLGARYFESGQFNEAIEQLQIAQEDAKLRREVQGMMAQALMSLGGWEAEAVATYRQALDGMSELDSDAGMALRYGLMTALTAFARKERDPDAAKEAEKIAGAIAIKSFSYRDIREQREAIKQLVKELGG